ncbi:Ca2+ transporter [Dactylonectria macrodidyma]|uniref:Ca2+ transporter n=1 Tax=Dactylonectria macrodidyma TaxID=307937 RepID=A0A9P9E8D7_9HYPO|nr:Ca2+ transporter [Dactylonectria macrodidyma]
MIPSPAEPASEQSPLLSAGRGHHSCRQRLQRLKRFFKSDCYAVFLLLFPVLGIASGIFDKAPSIVFSLNFLALLSLSRLNLRQLSRVSPLLGPLGRGFWHAILDNAIICIVTIQKGAASVAQSCILGSLLANILLVIGSCFLIAGIRHSETSFSTTYASKASSLMIVASTSLVVPSAMAEVHCRVDPVCEEPLLRMSRTVSIALLLLFLIYLHYRLRSHRAMFHEPTFAETDSRSNAQSMLLGMFEGIHLVVVQALASRSAYFLVDVLDAVTDSPFISDRVASFALLPLAADGPFRLEAIMAAHRNEMATALDYAIGRSMNLALFATPCLVLFSWVVQSSCPMTLHFPTLETISIFLGMTLVAELCRDGKSDYLEGAMCLVMYGLPCSFEEISTNG